MFLRLLGAFLFFSSVSISAKANNPLCGYSYIPPHDRQELEDVRAWAVGGAFRIFERYTNLRWDQASYLADVPNQALFNFGFVTATSCLELDVLQFFLGAEAHFMNLIRRYREQGLSDEQIRVEFSRAYLTIAEAYEMDQYITGNGVAL